ncbi:MAG: hypothetical protein MJ230_04450 [bacterium]|nr:hypothetical protein [bacterium]
MYEKLNFKYARDSLGYLINEFKIKELHIPYYLCDVIRHRVFEEGCTPIFYHIDDEFHPDKEFAKDSFILYPNYFGICDENVNKLEKIYSKLIVDKEHAYYLPPQGFACFNSARKFLPVENGSDLYIKTAKKKGKSAFLKPICPTKRREEFKLLHEIHRNTNLINIKKIPQSPFCYPYLANNDDIADKVAEELTNQGKIIYRYWNMLPKSYNEYKFYRRLVPIPLLN